MPERAFKPMSAEGTQREKLAEYFLNTPAYREQTPKEQLAYRQRLRQLGALDNHQVLEAAGSMRPLTYGDPVPLLQSLLTAAQRLAAGVGQPLLIFPARETEFHFQALIHPRLLGLATVNMLRAACLAAPKQPVWVHIREQADFLAVNATTACPWKDAQAAAVIKECARLHGGDLTQSEHSLGFSCCRATQLPQQVYPCTEYTAEEFYDDPLSPVWTGFYAWLFPEITGEPVATDQPTDNASKPNTPSEKDTSEA